MNLSEFKATLGLDWADRQHDIWIRPADGSKPVHRRVEHSAEALHEWVAQLRARFPEGRVALGIETSRGPVISALLAYDFIVIFPINPKALKNYRDCFGVSGAKSDDADARLIEEYVRLHGEKLKPLQPDDTLTRQIGGWDWAPHYYKACRARHEDQHHQACRSLAYKLIRIYFACWKNRTEYRQQTYLEALKKSGSPYRATAETSGE